MESSEDDRRVSASASASSSTIGNEDLQVASSGDAAQEEGSSRKGITRVKKKLSSSSPDPDLEKLGTFVNPLVGHIEHRVTVVCPSVVGIEVEVEEEEEEYDDNEQEVKVEVEVEKPVTKETRNSLIEHHDEDSSDTGTAQVQVGTERRDGESDMEEKNESSSGVEGNSDASRHAEKSNAKQTRNVLIDDVEEEEEEEEEKETHSVFSVNPLNPSEVEMTPLVPQTKKTNTSIVNKDKGGNFHGVLPMAVNKTQSGQLVNPLFEPCYEKYKLLSYLPALEVHEIAAGGLMLTILTFIFVMSEQTFKQTM